MVKLRDGNISLRALEETDVRLMYQWENDTTLWDISDTVSPFSLEALSLFVKTSVYCDTSDQMRLIICFNDNPIGCVDLFSISRVNHNASVGVLVYGKEYRNRGYATIALKLLERFAYESLEIHTLKAEVNIDNINAQKLFKGLGYDNVGILKKWKRVSNGVFKDVIIFQHILI